MDVFILLKKIVSFFISNGKVMTILYSKYVQIMSIYYFALMYVHIMLKKCEEKVKIVLNREQKIKKKL